MRQPTRKAVLDLISRLRPLITDKELIRLGPTGDGGYLLPDDLKGIKACFSPGVGNISEFEKDCLELGMKVFMADNSVDSPMLPNYANRYKFDKKHIGCFNNESTITLDEWIGSSRISRRKDLLLQMDIEGGEYIALLNISEPLLNRFRIMVIEFHDLDSIWNRFIYNIMEPVFDRILQNHYCVHIHPNNCCGLVEKNDVIIPKVAEFTFLRKDRAKFKKGPMTFPHKLDYNNTSNETIVLPDIWYKEPGT